MTKNGEGSRFLLGGTNTVDAPLRFDAHPSPFVDAVRRMMAVGYRPTISPGDGFGPVARDGVLVSVSVEWVAEWAFHTPTEAERAAAAMSAGGGDALVVLYDRVYNVVRLAGGRATADLANALNEHAFRTGRFRCAHDSIDHRPPAVVAIALDGYPYVVASGGSISPAAAPPALATERPSLGPAARTAVERPLVVD